MKRRGGTIVMQAHRWCGFGFAHDLFLFELRLGFISIAACRYCLNDRLALLAAELASLRDLVKARSAKDRDGSSGQP